MNAHLGLKRTTHSQLHSRKTHVTAVITADTRVLTSTYPPARPRIRARELAALHTYTNTQRVHALHTIRSDPACRVLSRVALPTLQTLMPTSLALVASLLYLKPPRPLRMRSCSYEHQKTSCHGPRRSQPGKKPL